MISILDPRAWIAAVALCVAAVGIGYWRGNVAGRASVQAEWDAEKTKQQQAIIEATQSDMHAGQQASTDYQQVISNEQERIRIVRETVVRTITGPCLDDRGLRITNQAIGGISAASAAR